MTKVAPPLAFAMRFQLLAKPRRTASSASGATDAPTLTEVAAIRAPEAEDASGRNAEPCTLTENRDHGGNADNHERELAAEERRSVSLGNRLTRTRRHCRNAGTPHHFASGTSANSSVSLRQVAGGHKGAL